MVQRLSERAKTDLALSRGGKEEKGGRAHESKGKKKGTDQTHTKGGKREETLRTWRGRTEDLFFLLFSPSLFGG